MKKEKEIHAGFAVTHQTPEAMAAVHEKCSVKLEKALGLWEEDRTLTWLMILLVASSRKVESGLTGCHKARAIHSRCLAT